MRLIDIVNAPWAVTPEMHREVQGIYARHCRGEKINVADIEARIGGPLPGPTRGYQVENGVAILPIEGVLAKRMNLFMQISGGTSMQLAARDFNEALADPEVNSIVLAIDSPGGTVDGTQELADAIFNARGTKPVIALADGFMASAAYWIGSSASRVFITSETTVVGSIGVVQAHMDVSRAEELRGVKTTEVTAGKFKRIASQYGPLSAEGRATIQDQVDQVYSVFVEAVARNRGVSADTVLEDMADGRVFIGQQAINAGLVDGVSTLDRLIARAAAGEFDLPEGDDDDPYAAQAGYRLARNVSPQPKAEQSGGASERDAVTDEEAHMNIEKLKAEHPDVAAALIEEGRKAGLEEGRKAGADAERERIKAVEDQTMSGHDALIATLKYDGKTTGPEAAVQVLAAEKAKKGNKLNDLRADATDATVTHAAMPDDEEDDEDDGEEGDGKAKKATVSEISNARVVAQRAQDYQAKAAAEGRKVSTAEAVDHVTREMKKERRHG